MATLRGRGCFQKSWVGVCGPLPKTLTLFMTKICVSLLPYLWPVQKFDSLFTTVAADTVAPNISYEGLLLLVINKDENVASKKHTQFKTRVLKPYPICNQNGQNQYPIYDQNGWKTLPFGAAHTYLAHIREYPQLAIPLQRPPLYNDHLWSWQRVHTIHSYVNLSTMAMCSYQQWPSKCIPNDPNYLSIMAS